MLALKSHECLAAEYSATVGRTGVILLDSFAGGDLAVPTLTGNLQARRTTLLFARSRVVCATYAVGLSIILSNV